MYFKKIYMHGFKSFADPVTIEFHRGITCIVGPNGSGKSNISDAIRWVLGEQSPKMLRGGKMEEVIFSGTASRKSRGMAEVILTIDNSTGILPIEYSEVAITRRMYRSGESEYYINNSQCRLRDIRELIMDTGIGVDGYSLIGQGKIADIVSNKTESRREIFEEAAGIVMYRTRKAEAERKLTAASGNLDRVNDIISEIEGRIDGLREDSAKASEYISLRERFRELEINITLKNVEGIEEKTNELINELKETDKSIAEIKDKKEKLDKSLEATNSRVRALDEITEETRARLMDIVSDINRLEKAHELNTERLAAIGRDRQRLTSEISELDGKLQIERQNAESMMDSRYEQEAKLTELNAGLQAAIDRYTLKAEEVNNALVSLNSERNSIFEYSSKASAKRTEAAGLDSLKESLEKRKLQIAAERESESLQGKSEADLQNAADKAGRLKADLESIREEAGSIRKIYGSSSETAKQLAKDIETLKIDISRKEARKKTIEEMESNYEGYNFAVKYIMKAGISGIYGTAAELMSVPKGYETAIETAMGAAMQNIICEDDDCAKKAILSLKQAKAGRLTFIPLKSIRHQRAAADVSSFAGFLGYGDRCVSFDSRYAAAFEYLLGRVVIVDTMDNAAAMSKKAGAGLRFVTLEGEIINTVGAITGGKYKNKTANLLERKSEITNLQEEIEALSQKRDAKMLAMNEASDEMSRAQEKLQALNDSYRQTELDLMTAENEKNAVEGAISDFSSRQERWDRELKSIEEQKASSDSMAKSLADEAEEADEAARLAEANVAGLSEVYETAKQEAQDASEDITEARIAVTACEKELQSAGTIYQRISDNIDEISGSIEARKLQLENLENEYTGLMASSENGEDIEVRNRQKQEAEETIEQAAAEKALLTEQTDGAAAEKAMIDEQLENLQSQKINADIKKARYETQLENLKDKLWETFEISYLQAMEFRSEDFVMSKAVKENREVKARMNELGDVNIGAIEEYKAVSERYGFLTSQRADILEAMGSLRAIIEDMDKTIRTKFKENFDQVVVQFEYIFRELFGGGHAQLRLDNEDNPLESNIDIIAQPPGKKLQNINLLSGGEKTMTAIALMFAVLKTKPTPFCILDEVEAALDDANIERFAKYLQNFGEIQFALVTHQKVTMEYADVLYGVTMPEHGISKILSLRLGDKFDLD